MTSTEKSRILFGTVVKYKYAKNITDETLCKRLGISQNTFTAKKTNPEKFTVGEMITMFDFLGVPKEERGI